MSDLPFRSGYDYRGIYIYIYLFIYLFIYMGVCIYIYIVQYTCEEEPSGQPLC